MNKLLLSAAGLVAIATSASAADLAARPYTKAPPPATVWVPSWTGFYLGAHGGCGWSRSSTPTNYAVDPGEIGDPVSFSSDRGEGCFGGGQVGYNYQLSNNVVLGIEADASFGRINSSFNWTQGIAGLPGVVDDLNSWESRLTSFGTVRARLGYAAGAWLPYVTGGWAWGRNRLSVACPTSCDNFGDPATSSDSQTHYGWVVGAGLEYAISQNWSVKAEYLHLELDSKRYNIQVDFDNGVPAGADSGRLKIDTVKAGVNYRFGWGSPVVARY
jgi:outer membrane immunogenic protein